METILKNTARIGRFTSSDIVRLTGTDKVFNEYIEEKRMERRLGRSLNDERNARALAWGKLLEKRVFELLGLEYELYGDTTLEHPTIKCWAGSPDVRKTMKAIAAGSQIESCGTLPADSITVKVVGDVKCPLTLKSFCTMVDQFHLGGQSAIASVRKKHSEGEKYYWQLVSNAILTGAEIGELIVYVPYISELDDIKLMITTLDGADIDRYYTFYRAQNEELPHLIEGRHYKNMNVLQFPIPKADKDFLTERVLKAEKLLNMPL